MTGNALASNIKEYIKKNDLSMRDFARISSISPATISRILNSTDVDSLGLQTKTVHNLEKVIGLSYDELCSSLMKQKHNSTSNNEIYFIDLDLNRVGGYITADKKFSYAIHITSDLFSPLIPQNSIIFLSKNSGFYQKDIALVHKNDLRFLGVIETLYRDKASVTNILNNETINCHPQDIKAVILSQLNPS